MTRQRPSLKLPGTQDLSRFPSTRLTPATQLYRVTRTGNGPWHFSSDLRGRFDLPSPDGTCYLARDMFAALLEVIGPELPAVSSTFLNDRRIYKVRVPLPQRLADLTSRRAAGYSMTAEIGTITPYLIPQAWARALHAAGLDGLAYSVRHDPSPRRDGVALFGLAGERRWRRGRPSRLGHEIREALRARCGIRVLGIPRSDELAYEGG